MKIEEAIEILKEVPNTVNNDTAKEQDEALKLGIEALKEKLEREK